MLLMILNQKKNWEKVNIFISENRDFMTASNIYRTADKSIQEDILRQAKITNGRITALENFQKEVETKIQDRKDSKINQQNLVTIITAIVMAVSALVMIFKK